MSKPGMIALQQVIRFLKFELGYKRCLDVLSVCTHNSAWFLTGDLTFYKKTFICSPFTRYGMPLGGRSTAIQLRAGGVWILASTPLDAETKTTLNKLGPVK
jgi:hypothetical protein